LLIQKSVEIEDETSKDEADQALPGSQLRRVEDRD